MEQATEYISKPMSGEWFGEERSVRVEQVIAPDGKPAVRVRIFKQTMHNGQLVYQPEHRPCISDKLFRFPSPRPIELLGRPLVGQWADKELQQYRVADCTPNPDPATYMDYEAWSDAFHQIYSES